MQHEDIPLTAEETADLAPLIARLEGQASGYAEAVEVAKRLIVKKFLDNRKAGSNGTSAESEHAAAGCAPANAEQPVPQVQPAGASEPERTGGGTDINGSADVSAALAGCWKPLVGPGSLGGLQREQQAGASMGVADDQPIERAATDAAFTGATAPIPAVFPISGTAEPWLERAFNGDDGTNAVREAPGTAATNAA